MFLIGQDYANALFEINEISFDNHLFSRYYKKWDHIYVKEDVVPAVLVSCLSALLFNGLGLLWFAANVQLSESSSSLFALFALAVITAGYCTIRFSPMISTVLGFILTLQIGRALGSQTGYLVYSAGAYYPLIDAQLYAIDRWLGFDWLEMLHWFGSYPFLVQLTRVIYEETAIQGILALPIMILARQHIRLMNFLAATFLALFVVHIVSVFLPAIGVYGYLGLTGADHPLITLTSEGLTAAHVMQLRTRELFDLNTVSVMGLITFPSFHTIMAVQAVWLFWRHPVFRWPAVVINLPVLMGTLFHGSHHLIDTIVGAAVGAVAIYAACGLTAMARRRLYGVVPGSIRPSRPGARPPSLDIVHAD